MSVELPKVEHALDVTIEKLVYGGEGLARTPEGVLLVPGVIPGERAQVLPEPPRRGVRHGRLVQLAESSADRVAAECPYFGRCGVVLQEARQVLAWKRLGGARVMQRRPLLLARSLQNRLMAVRE